MTADWARHPAAKSPGPRLIRSSERMPRSRCLQDIWYIQDLRRRSDRQALVIPGRAELQYGQALSLRHRRAARTREILTPPWCTEARERSAAFGFLITALFLLCHKLKSGPIESMT